MSGVSEIVEHVANYTKVLGHPDRELIPFDQAELEAAANVIHVLRGLHALEDWRGAWWVDVRELWDHLSAVLPLAVCECIELGYIEPHWDGDALRTTKAGRSLFRDVVERSAYSVLIVGPSVGVPHFNYPNFHAAAQDLRMLGYAVTNPAEWGSDEERDRRWKSLDGSYGIEGWRKDTSAGIKGALDHDITVVLPGWADSRQAVAQVLAAYALGKPIRRYPDWSPVEVDGVHVAMR